MREPRIALHEPYILESDKELDIKKLQEFLTLHDKECRERLQPLLDAYRSDYPIFSQPEKPDWKPDHRIAVNFAKYMVDTNVGFFTGIPVRISAKDSADESLGKYLEFLESFNGLDDTLSEIAKMCDIFGYGYEMYYISDKDAIEVTYVSPLESFMIYDDSIIKRKRYFVRYYIDSDKILHGSLSDETTVRYFERNPTLRFTGEEKLHGFDGVPAEEYIENEDCVGLFEPVYSLINNYNRAISEKANDVDYFSDAYLKILGAKLETEELKDIRTNRIINFNGRDSDKIIAEFLAKPSGDETQEHLLARLERLIFQVGMIADISSDSFGTASGIAIRYRLWAMQELADTKARKFTASLNERYRLIFSNPLSAKHVAPDDWMRISYKFTQNYPANLLEEADIAGKLSGITSQETQLKVLSLVEDVQQEIETKKRELDEQSYDTDYPTARTEEE